jgi:serine/threonine protein kinase
MNAAHAKHPTDQTLHAYGLGKLEDILFDTVNQHLDACPECRRRVAELSSDSFLHRLRDAQGRDDPSSPVGSATEGRSGASSMAAPASGTGLAPDLARHPDYDIIRELGRGGMGIVYLALNRIMNRREALKVVHEHILNQPGVRKRFMGEIRNAARLHHPNIVTAYSALPLETSLVLAMEYVEGLDLARILKSKGALPLANACNYIYQAAHGLQHAHELGLVHRDIKPSNLVLSRLGERAVIKILDFGLAKLRSEPGGDGTLTQAGQLLGTPDYIAPEQIRDARRADIRADIYSLGCTFYHLVSGSPPFQGATLYEIYQAHHSMNAPLLNLARPDVPVELAIVVATMMAKEPERRFHDPKEVTQALSPFLKKQRETSQQSKPELSRGSMAAPHALSAGAAYPQSGAMESVPNQPVMSAAPVPSAPAAKPAAGRPPLEMSIETNEERSLSEEVRALRDRGRLPFWLWPAVAGSLLIIGIIVGWRLNAGSRAEEGASAASEKPVSPRGKADHAPSTTKPVDEPRSRVEIASASNAAARSPEIGTPDRRNPRVAPKPDTEAPPPIARENENTTESPAAKPKIDVKSSLAAAAAAPKPKSEAELTPEELIDRRGLIKKQMHFCIQDELEVEAAYNRAQPVWNRAWGAWTDYVSAVDRELTWQDLDNQRINLQTGISERIQFMNSLPNNVDGRVTRVQLQQEQQAAQLALTEVTRYLAIAAKARPRPGEIEGLAANFMGRRQEYQAESDNLRPIFVKVLRQYEALKQDDALMNAIRTLSGRTSAPLRLGPSEYFRKAQTYTAQRVKALSDDPDAYRRRKKRPTAVNPKGKKQSMPSGEKKKQD